MTNRNTGQLLSACASGTNSVLDNFATKSIFVFFCSFSYLLNSQAHFSVSEKRKSAGTQSVNSNFLF